MKRVDKIFLIDDDSIANFVNKHLIDGLGLTDELEIIHDVQLAKQALFAQIEQLDHAFMQEFVVLLNIQLDAQRELLPSHLATTIPPTEGDSLLILVISYNKLNDPELLFHIEGCLSKPITREHLSVAWQKIP